MSLVLSRIGSLFAQRGVQIVTAGLISGVVGGSALVATGLIPIGGTPLAPTSVALTACPGSGQVLAQLPAGQTLLVTARSADGGWLQVYIGEPGTERAWAPASALSLQSAADGLPVADCSAPSTPLVAVGGTTAPTATAVVISPSPGPTLAATAPPSATPTPTPTPSPTPRPTPRPTPTPTPTPHPTPHPTPTPAPTDGTPPVLTNLTVDPTYNGYTVCSGTCSIWRTNTGCNPDSATIFVAAKDPDDAVKSVTLYYTEPATSITDTQAMTFDAALQLWQGTITAGQFWNQSQIVYWTRGTDTNGNTSAALYPTSGYYLYVHTSTC